MVITIDAATGAIVSVKGDKTSAKKVVGQPNWPKLKVKKTSTHQMVVTNPCVYYYIGGRWYRVCR
jgi:hypothetical protein